jgi:signal transduction histidine kinase
VQVSLRALREARRRDERAEALPPGMPATAIECTVADTGCGVADEDRERIFDPFFTTRAAGEGTGLGLANALRMAEQQGGALNLAAAPAGFRTAFVLRLPSASSASSSGRRRGDPAG